MISLINIVKHIRTACPSFHRRVGGTAEFSAATKEGTTDLDVPHAFVIPMYGEDMGQFSPNPEVDTEKVRENFAVVVCIDNRVNRAGAAGLSKLDPLEQLVAIQKELTKAFLGWRMTPQYDPTRYSRDAHLGMSNTRMWHQWEWHLDRLSNADEVDATYAEVAAFVNEINADGTAASGPTNGLRTIHAHGNLVDVPDPLSYDDLWPEKGTPGAEPTPEALAAARARAEFNLPVLPTDPAPPSPEEIGGKATQAPPPTLEENHGVDVEVSSPRPSPTNDSLADDNGVRVTTKGGEPIGL